MTQDSDDGPPPSPEENIPSAVKEGMESTGEENTTVSAKESGDSNQMPLADGSSSADSHANAESTASKDQEYERMGEKDDIPMDDSKAEQKQPSESSQNTAAEENDKASRAPEQQPNAAAHEISEKEVPAPGVNDAPPASETTNVLPDQILASDSNDNSHSKEAIRRSGSLLDQDEDGDGERNPESRAVKGEEEPPEVSNLSLDSAKEPPSTGGPAAQPSSKGAQILMSRFSTWRRNTNRALTRNAESLMNSPVGQSLTNQARASLFSSNESTATDVKAEQNEEPNKKEDTDGKEAVEVEDSFNERSISSSGSLEEEGSATSTSSSDLTSHDDDSTTRRQEDNSSLETTPRSSLEESSVMTEETPSERQKRVADAAVVVQAAASGIVDSVASGFRGRYSAGTEPTADTTPRRKGRSTVSMTESQTALIMKSRAASHMQSILDSLEPHEYVMLLGRGMLGVNLKQTYLKNNGVYMDYFLPGGAAEASGVVHAGDVLVKVGETDVRRGTIQDVPDTIANSRRPVVLVFSNGMDMEMDRMNYIDVAVTMMHKIRDESNKLAIASMPLHVDIKEIPENEETEEKDEGGDENASSNDEIGHSTTAPEAQIPDVEVPMHSFVDFNYMNPPSPPAQVKELLFPHIAKRCNDKFSVSMMTHAATSNDNFRAALRNAFLCCSLDGRRLPFLAAHFSSEEFYDSEASPQKTDDDSQQTLASRQLMLFLELVSFVDLYGVTPVSRRRDIAKRIAHKFFLPVMEGSILKPPMFDFHHILPDSNLRLLEQMLNDTQRPIDRDLYVHFQEAVLDSLSGPTVVSFLVSDECSRMRAYLRNTAPFVNVSLRDMFDAMVNEDSDARRAAAQNHFSFILMHLLCLTENEAGTENDDLRVGVGNNRVIGLAGGISCVVYIRRDLCKCIRAARIAMQDDEDLSSKHSAAVIRALVDAFNHLWESFVAPDGGALDCFSSSSETGDALETVRGLLQNAVLPVKGARGKAERDRHLVGTLTKSELSDALDHLAEELLNDYAVNTYPKYREHKFHEWMCGEVCKLSNPIASAEEETPDHEGVLPGMPDGCIRRLFRKLELPVGVSSHKPIRSVRQLPPSKKSEISGSNSLVDGRAIKDVSAPSEDRWSNVNAEYAIVFGTDDGLHAAGQIPSPTLGKVDVRRYVCQAVAVGQNLTPANATLNEKNIPPTLESYAAVPLFREKPFSRVVDNTRLSADGWEISLVNFMVPNADVSSEETQNGSLFGVSLVFQMTDEAARAHLRNDARSPIELVYSDVSCASGTPCKKKENVESCQDGMVTPAPSGRINGEEVVFDSDGSRIDVSAFASPISFLSPSKETTAEESASRSRTSETHRHIKVHEKTPKFNRRLGEKPWLDRVLDHRLSTSQNGSISVGVALISGGKSILAMRETLSRLLFDHARTSDEESKNCEGSLSQASARLVCGPLVDLLGNFSHKDVESVTLKCILEPYLRFASSPWTDQSLRDQPREYCDLAGQQLIQTLPPIPLALLFVTVLLEQKIVFSSSRRSILFAATTCVTELLHPLKWSHLLVPLVPATLARDLVQYPAPFILGIPSEDPGNMDLLNTLPDDVTLVDLDVGRVILAPKFAYDDGLLRGSEDEAITAKALRSQVLYLAQAMGVLFGSRLHDQTWCGDSPLFTLSGSHDKRANVEGTSDFQKLQCICGSFLTELLSGSPSCCYWVEEQKHIVDESVEHISSEPDCTVLFDEDRFFHIKNLRASGRFQPFLEGEDVYASEIEGHLRKDTGLALTLDNFDLVLESFLRCQSMSTFISSIPRGRAVFY